MTTTELNKWFNTLDSSEMALIFPSLYEHVMESADPSASDINYFVKEAKKKWRKMTPYDKSVSYWKFIEY